MYQIKLKSGSYMVPVNIVQDEQHIYLQFAYNKILLNEIKLMEGAKWLGYADPPRKIWQVSNSPRNKFQLDYLQGKNPYAHYDKEIVEHDYQRILYSHQNEATDFILTRKRCILAGEMGVGKTLDIVEVLERVNKELSGQLDTWYVAPKSALAAVKMEFKKWNSKYVPNHFMTYERLTKIVKTWDDNIGRAHV